MPLDISFIIPVYNRPDEIDELLLSMTQFEGDFEFEVVIIEDGSSIKCEHIISKFKDQLHIAYFFKPNSGPGDSRNFGMQKASGNYFIILDSDVIMPKQYLRVVTQSLDEHYVDCFGGPDAAHQSFSNLQKAINFSMTSFMTTGGIRGNKKSVNTFQPRSFNMGLSKAAFEASKGFGRIHPGEDPDLSIRLQKLGFKTKLIPNAYVYHKRRISWSKFYKQVNKFGQVRPILNKWHPETKKLTYWFPLFFVLGLLFSIVLTSIGIYFPLMLFVVYFILIFVMSMASSGNLMVAIMSIVAVLIQFTGYGLGFLKSTFKLKVSKGTEEDLFPNLFFIR